jgi:hypothetical protein
MGHELLSSFDIPTSILEIFQQKISEFIDKLPTIEIEGMKFNVVFEGAEDFLRTNIADFFVLHLFPQNEFVQQYLVPYMLGGYSSKLRDYISDETDTISFKTSIEGIPILPTYDNLVAFQNFVLRHFCTDTEDDLWESFENTLKMGNLVSVSRGDELDVVFADEVLLLQKEQIDLLVSMLKWRFEMLLNNQINAIPENCTIRFQFPPKTTTEFRHYIIDLLLEKGYEIEYETSDETLSSFDIQKVIRIRL